MGRSWPPFRSVRRFAVLGCGKKLFVQAPSDYSEAPPVDPFAPCGADALLVDAEDPAYRSQIDTLLDELPGMLCAEDLAEQAAGCAALKAATELVGSRGGGHVVMFHASLPNSGIGALRHRDDIKLASEPEGGGLFNVQQPTFIEEIGNDCLVRGVAVSVFCAPATGIYIDMASLSRIPRRTGGEICFYPGFDPSRDGERLHYDLSRTVVQSSVYSVMFKLRVSKGLAVDSMHATWDPEVIDPSTFAVSRMSVDATVDFTLVHGERIEGQKQAYMQVACLYTSKKGKRLIRVHTLQLPVTSSLSNVFRYTEIDTVTNLLLKQAADSALSGNGSFKDKLTKACVDMLHAYRANCASMTSAGQLILPESLKLLPLYIGSIRKFPAFRAGSDIKVDDRLLGQSIMKVLGLDRHKAFQRVRANVDQETLYQVQDINDLLLRAGFYVKPAPHRALKAKVTTISENGDVMKEGGASVTCMVTGTSLMSKTQPEPRPFVEDMQDGTYNIQFVCATPGSYEINALVDGNKLPMCSKA
ncbi:unnamed protein product [Durusdinium trenchii]|uniref:SEC63 domain-containing protein n=1 Tax=Durusdinium trenchii TaxID=1381693 RepID=A0ABP0Q345_9DINO